jgi:hypothetical protein
LGVDERRHDLMLDLTGTDALALDEIALAFDVQIDGGRPDLAACTVLAAHREVPGKNTALPATAMLTAS